MAIYSNKKTIIMITNTITQIKLVNSEISEKQQIKLIKSLPSYLKSKEKALEKTYGKIKTNKIISVAIQEYPEIVKKTPNFNTPMYDSLMRLASKMAALKKGMRATGLNTEEFVKFNIDQTRLSSKKIPSFFRKTAGKIYLSKLIRKYLNKVGKCVTANGWPTTLINGTKKDEFTMSIETKNCQMVAFFEAIGEGDIRPYCTFFDFTAAEILGIGLKQVSTIDSGICKYCFYKRGTVEWPDPVQQIFKN